MLTLTRPAGWFLLGARRTSLSDYRNCVDAPKTLIDNCRHYYWPALAGQLKPHSTRVDARAGISTAEGLLVLSDSDSQRSDKRRESRLSNVFGDAPTTVSYLPLPKKEWEMTPSAFGKLLACLHADYETAGEEYERIRQKLTIYFEGRRCSPADEHADEVINRVARKLDEGENVRDLNRYVFGVARLLRLEILRQPQSEGESDESLGRLTVLPDVDPPVEGRMDFLERCLNKLPPESKEMIVEYYQGERREKIDARGLLAKRYGLTTNGLKVRVCRIRAKLEDCINDCIRRMGESA